MSATKLGLVRNDNALSDLVGTVMVLGVTVMLVGVMAVQMTSSDSPRTEPPRLDMRVSAEPGKDTVKIQHRGGAAFDAGELRAIIVVNGASWYDDAVGASGDTWRLGETLTVGPLASNLTPGAALDVTVVHKGAGATLAATSSIVPPNATTTPQVSGFTVNVTFENGKNTIKAIPPTEVYVYAKVAHPNGRKSVSAVTANFSALGGNTASPLMDDGTRGDKMPADSTFTGFFLVPPNATKGIFNITITATAFDGSRAQGNGTVAVTEVSPIFNPALIDTFGFRLLKYESNTGAGDKITVHLKVRSWDEPVTLEDGTQWTLRRAYVLYDPFKPGDRGELALEEGAMGTKEKYHCTDDTTFVRAWKVNNATVPKWDKDRDLLRYYIKLVWAQVGGSDEHTDTIETNERDQYFLLRRSEAHHEVRENGAWPAVWTDCSNTSL